MAKSYVAVCFNFFLSIAVFWTQTFHKVVQQQIYGLVEYLIMSILHIYHWVCQRKNFENWLTFGEVMGKSLVSCFLTHIFWLTVYLK